MDEADRQGQRELAAARLVEDAAAQARAQHVQLRLAHRALEAEQQPVVEVRRVVDAVLVQDERVGQRADLQQSVPVGGVACEAGNLQAEHDTCAPHPDLGDQLLEPRAVHGGRQIARDRCR